MVLKKKDGPFQPSGETRRIIPLGGGSYAYIFDHLGKTHRCKVESQAFVDLCNEIDGQMKGRIRRELMDLGWLEALHRMGRPDGDTES